MTIYLTGDLHGSIGEARTKIAQIEEPKEEDILIILGDCGFQYGDSVQGQVKKYFKKEWPGDIIAIRGNHDNRYWRDNEGRDGWETSNKYGSKTLVQKKYPNIHYVKDAGDVYTFGEYNFLIIPGAYSVDKYYRLRSNYPYEMEELLTANEMEQILKYANDFKNDIDFVLAHTAPMKIEPKLWYLFMNGVNQDEVDKTMENWLDDVMNVIEDGNNFKQYFFGHFHDDKKLDENYTMLYHCVEKLDDYIEKGE